MASILNVIEYAVQLSAIDGNENRSIFPSDTTGGEPVQGDSVREGGVK